MAKSVQRAESGSSASSVDTSTHPLVTAVLGDSDPPADKVVLIGYFGPSKRPNSVRLYLGLDFMSYYEIPLDGVSIIATEPVDPSDPHSATRVIVKGDAQLELVYISGIRGEAEFLQGNITGSLLARAIGSEPLEEMRVVRKPLYSTRFPKC
jgi:hypothetical protein